VAVDRGGLAFADGACGGVLHAAHDTIRSQNSETPENDPYRTNRRNGVYCPSETADIAATADTLGGKVNLIARFLRARVAKQSVHVGPNHPTAAEPFRVRQNICPNFG
jgi:hypothetical protein